MGVVVVRMMNTGKAYQLGSYLDGSKWSSPVMSH